jgi:hypothetical protein
MDEYYNFKVSEHEISFEPYWYHKSNILIHFSLGIIILGAAVILFTTGIFKKGLLIGVFVSALLFLNGLYRSRIKNKTTLIFDKKDDALYKITPTGKKKLLALHKIYCITAISENRYYYYTVIHKKKSSVKRIPITPFIQSKNQSNPEIRFLEMEIIPQIELFLNFGRTIDKKGKTVNEEKTK